MPLDAGIQSDSKRSRLSSQVEKIRSTGAVLRPANPRYRQVIARDGGRKTGRARAEVAPSGRPAGAPLAAYARQHSASAARPEVTLRCQELHKSDP